MRTTPKLVSEVFFEVWRQAGDFERRSQVATWILAIARFKALSASRRRRDAALDDVEAAVIEDTTDSPEQMLLKIDRRAKLRTCLAQMSREHREIIDLVYYHEKTITEIAQIIRVPKNTVKTRMFYARKNLRRLLVKHEEFGQP